MIVHQVTVKHIRPYRSREGWGTEVAISFRRSGYPYLLHSLSRVNYSEADTPSNRTKQAEMFKARMEKID